MGANGTPWVWRCSVTCVITPPPHLARGTEHNADTPPRPTAVTGLQAAAGGRMIAGLRPFPARASRHAPAERADKMVNGTSRPLPPGSPCRGQVSAARLHIAGGRARQV